MPYSLLPTLLLQILVLGYSPGPANIYALTMSLRHERKQVMVMWLGLLTGFSIAICIMALLTHYVGLAIGHYVQYLKYVGAAYILYLAWTIWKKSGKLEEDQRGCSFANGMLVQMTNAKILLFEVTVFSTFVLPYSSRILDLFEVAAWLVLAGPGANLAWLLAGSFLRKFSEKYSRQINIASAIALVLCAIYIIVS